MKAGSAIKDADTPITPTAYGRTDALAEPNNRRINAESMPERSAIPTARMMGNT